MEELGALEGGEEAQKDEQNSFTARTTHVAARLKVCTYTHDWGLVSSTCLTQAAGRSSTS